MSFTGIASAGTGILGATIPAILEQPPSGTVELRPSRGTTVLLLLADPPDRSGGVGGWATTERQFDTPGRWWSGTPVDQMSIAGMLDQNEHANGQTIKTRLGWLYAMATPGAQNEPPTVKLAGDITPRDRQLTWIIQDISLGDRVMTGPGTFGLQYVTVALEGYDQLPRVAKASVKRTRAPGSSQPRRRVIRTVKGDTLRTIAVKQLGSSSQYTQIREWNKTLAKTDPDQPLRAGLLVVLH